MNRSACAEWIVLLALLVPSAAAADCGECTIPTDCVPSFSRCVWRQTAPSWVVLPDASAQKRKLGVVGQATLDAMKVGQLN